MKKEYIDRTNNFDFLRLILASLVIVSHSFTLTGNEEIFDKLTNGQAGLGGLSVDCFFILSGYFIFQSLQRSKSISSYLWKRLLRIYPALIVLMIFTAILLLILYSGNDKFIFFKSYLSYATGCLSLYNVQYSVKGIFESNPYKGAINGSLWSLSYEFTMYILLLLLFKWKKNNKIYLIIFFVFISSYFLAQFKPSFLTLFFKKIYLDTNMLYRLICYFFAGSILTFFDLKKINRFYVRVSLLLVLISSFIINCYSIISPLILPFFIIFIGAINTKHISSLTKKIGDISYGVYIYGFLIQQTLLNYFNLDPLELIILSLIITYTLAYLSWNFVEKKMLEYKNLI